MTNLILSSNFSGNKLFGVGEATLQDENIHISAEAGTTVILLRGANKVVLLKANSERLMTSGSVVLGDVYVLENNNNKLTIKVEQESTHHETSIYIDSEKIIDATSSKRSTTLTAGTIVLFLLIVSVFFGLKQKSLKEFNSNSEIKLTNAIENYELKTRESFIKARDIAFKLKEDGYKSDKLEDLIKKMNESESELLGEVRIDTKELLDLTLQINGFNGSKLASTNKKIFVLDQNEKNIIRLDVNGKNAEIVAKKDILDNLVDIASYEDRLFTLNKDGIYEINSSRNKVKDLDWGDSMFYLYSANIYMVDRGNNKIYRFSGNSKTFGEKTDWLAPGIEADFSKTIDMSIDGSIWTLSSTGKVTKFTNGNPTSILMEGIVSPLDSPTAIYTNEKLKYVYILDKNNGRVVVLEKNGKFKIQYVSDQIKNANDLVADEENKKAILLVGSKLIYFEPR